MSFAARRPPSNSCSALGKTLKNSLRSVRPCVKCVNQTVSIKPWCCSTTDRQAQLPSDPCPNPVQLEIRVGPVSNPCQIRVPPLPKPRVRGLKAGMCRTRVKPVSNPCPTLVQPLSEVSNPCPTPVQPLSEVLTQFRSCAVDPKV